MADKKTYNEQKAEQISRILELTEKLSKGKWYTEEKLKSGVQ